MGFAVRNSTSDRHVQGHVQAEGSLVLLGRRHILALVIGILHSEARREYWIFELPCGYWELKSGSSARAANTFNYRASLQPLKSTV